MKHLRRQFQIWGTVLPVFFVTVSACASTSSAHAPVSQSPSLDVTIEKSFDLLSGRLNSGSRIALLPIAAAANDDTDTEYIYENLTVLFINSGKYDMLERQKIEAVMTEQNFQMSGMVDDNTAVGVGHFLGAEIIIIGAIQGNTSTRRIVFRALDVRTAKIVGMVSERF